MKGIKFHMQIGLNNCLTYIQSEFIVDVRGEINTLVLLHPLSSKGWLTRAFVDIHVFLKDWIWNKSCISGWRKSKANGWYRAVGAPLWFTEPTLRPPLPSRHDSFVQPFLNQYKTTEGSSSWFSQAAWSIHHQLKAALEHVGKFTTGGPGNCCTCSVWERHFMCCTCFSLAKCYWNVLE